MTLDTESTLAHFIYGKVDTDNVEDSFGILAMSAGLTQEDALHWRSVSHLNPMNPTPNNTLAVGLFSSNADNYVIAQAVYQDNDPKKPLYHYVGISRELLNRIAGNISSLIEITSLDTDITTVTQNALPDISFPLMPTWAADKRLVLFNKLLTNNGDNMQMLFALLDALLSHRGVLIKGYSRDVNVRLNLIEAVLMLLPSPLRATVTFSTNVTEYRDIKTHFVFSSNDSGNAHNRKVIQFVDNQLAPKQSEFTAVYVQHLMNLWQGEMQVFINELRAIDAIANQVPHHATDWSTLPFIVDRHILDTHVLAGASFDMEQVKAVLKDNPPSSINLLRVYTERLIEYALVERDTESAQIVARYMDEHQDIDEHLNNILIQTLENEPDSVYLFIRTRLSQGTDERWLPRLQVAAVASLKVAIDDGDSETLIDWLRLIAREPSGYQLNDLVQEGIEAARKRTHEDSELGAKLIFFAAKRALNQIDRLLDDADLVNNLPDPLGIALRDFDPEAVATIVATGREIGLITLARVAEDANADNDANKVFTPAIINHLWSLHDEHKTTSYPPRYQPRTIVSRLVTDGTRWMTQDAIETLLTHIIADNEEQLYKQICSHLASQTILFPMLSTALFNSGLGAGDIITQINVLVTQDTITPQEAVNTHLQVVASSDWDLSSLPLIEQIARTLQQNADVTISQKALWHILDIVSEEQIEFATRIVARRLVTQIETIEDERELIADIQKLHERIAWSDNTQANVLEMWRNYIQHQPLTRLQHLDHLLDDLRNIVDYQAVTQTTIALRKMMGTRSLDEFAQSVGVAFTILQALSDSFDPVNRPTVEFDSQTVYLELDAREDELNSHERSLLAKNLKELAQLITTMADNRSKSSLIRREGNIERQLLSGEQSPQSAIDTMKWLSGYLNGLQNKDDNETP